MKNQVLLFITVLMATTSSFAQFTFVHLSDLHVSSVPRSNSDTNPQYFQRAVKKFANFNPKPSFVLVTGDISDIGNMQPFGMYSTLTQHLFPPSLTNPAVGDYFIDSAKTIPIYFTPGNHEYWTGFDSISLPISNDTLFYYPNNIAPDMDYVVNTDLAVIVVLRSGHDSPYGYPPNPALINGTGLSDTQCNWLRSTLVSNSSKRKIIVMHHPPVNAAGTNSDGTPFTELPLDTATNSLEHNRTNFLNICDSNHVDLVLAGHEHQNVVANRKGNVISENQSNGTRYVQTAASFNRSYRIITVDSAFVTVSGPMRSSIGTGVGGRNQKLNITVFLNPADDILSIGCTQKSEIEILSSVGQTLIRLTAKEALSTVDITTLMVGIYLIKVKTEEGIAVKKFLKQ